MEEVNEANHIKNRTKSSPTDLLMDTKREQEIESMRDLIETSLNLNTSLTDYTPSLISWARDMHEVKSAKAETLKSSMVRLNQQLEKIKNQDEQFKNVEFRPITTPPVREDIKEILTTCLTTLTQCLENTSVAKTQHASLFTLFDSMNSFPGINLRCISFLSKVISHLRIHNILNFSDEQSTIKRTIKKFCQRLDQTIQKDALKSETDNIKSGIENITGLIPGVTSAAPHTINTL